MLYNSLKSEECYISINNSSNKTSVSMLVTNYNQYHDLKLKDSEEFILSSRLMRVIKLRKHKSSITDRIQEALNKDISCFTMELSWFLKKYWNSGELSN